MRTETAHRIDDLETYSRLIRLLSTGALLRHARRTYEHGGREELACLRAEFRRRRAERLATALATAA